VELARSNVQPINREIRDLSEILAEYHARYSNPISRENIVSALRRMLRFIGKPSLAAITETDIHAWITEPAAHLANNTVRTRLSTARTFFRWLEHNGYIDKNPCLDLDRLTKQYPKTFGKVQSKHPARWLTHHEAFAILVGGTEAEEGPFALRDAIVLRLGLSGLRSMEIRALRVGDVDLGNPPQLSWMGKGRRSRSIVMGDKLTEAIRTYLHTWEAATRKTPQDTDYLINPKVKGGTIHRARTEKLQWGESISKTVIYEIVTDRANRAGLGHVAPHDLRRTTAGILHKDTSADGGHTFDLLDIQKVLGHADPATTQRSYLEPIDTEVNERASVLLD